MSKPHEKAVLILHGLHAEGEDPFNDLRDLETHLSRAGFLSLRFQWPAAHAPRQMARGLMSRSRSVSAELAAHLDLFLRAQIQGRFEDRRWIVLAHSAGGGIWFRWMTEHAAAFQHAGLSLPSQAFLLASPYRWEEGQYFQLEAGRLPVRGEASLDPYQLADILPERLIILLAENDATLPPSNTLFPEDLVVQRRISQYLIEHADHRSICKDPLTQRLIDHHLQKCGLR